MESGYIKLWRAALGNELLANDNTCWIVFTKLLLLVDKNTGAYRTGRKRLATLCNLKESTLYDALKRLEKATAIRQQTDSAATTIYICKWADYQQQTDNRPVRDQKNSDTKQEERKRKRIDTSSCDQLDHAHEWICKLFDKNPKRYKLSSKRRVKLKARLAEFSREDFKRAYQNVAQSRWHRGENDRGWSIDNDPYWLLNSYERMESWVDRQQVNGDDLPSDIDLSRAGIDL